MTYTYGITSLADKHDFLQQGDIVKFQIATVRSTGQKRATRIAAVRKYIRANVDSVKGQVNTSFDSLFVAFIFVAFVVRFRKKLPFIYNIYEFQL